MVFVKKFNIITVSVENNTFRHIKIPSFYYIIFYALLYFINYKLMVKITRLKEEMKQSPLVNSVKVYL